MRKRELIEHNERVQQKQQEILVDTIFTIWSCSVFRWVQSCFLWKYAIHINIYKPTTSELICLSLTRAVISSILNRNINKWILIIVFNLNRNSECWPSPTNGMILITTLLLTLFPSRDHLVYTALICKRELTQVIFATDQTKEEKE